MARSHERMIMIWKNAKIERVTLGPGERGMMTSCIHLSFDGTGQGFGNIALTSEICLSRWVIGVMAVLDVEDWGDLVGKHVRAGYETGTWGEQIKAIRPIIKGYPVFQPDDLENYNCLLLTGAL